MSEATERPDFTSSVDQYDYIVIGAGSAGCVVASRLAEQQGVTVALLESGPHDHHASVSTPVGVGRLVLREGPRNYGYHSEPQAALDDRVSYQPRGRGLGGSSSINGMVYIRGHRNDYDHWARLGCTGWSYDEVLPYFRRSEANQRASLALGNPYHGGDGPLYVSDLRRDNPFSRRFIEAAVQAGFMRNEDFNGASQDGVGLCQVTQYDGERWNAARAFLHRGDTTDTAFNGGRRRLAVLVDTVALRIEFDGKRAARVRVVRHGVERTLAARREIIVSAGAFNSPQLLMASGIGPAAHLREHGVAVIHHSPEIGENLQDHIDITIRKAVKSTELYGYALGNVARLAFEAMRYRRNRTGMLTSNLAEVCAFARSREGLAEPDLQFAFILALVGLREKKKLPVGYSCHATNLRPKSRGVVRLQSGDMRVAPLIDPRYFSVDSDMDCLVDGVRIIRRIHAQAPLAGMGGRELMTEHFGPGEGDEHAIRAYIRAHADTLFHPVGTCRMGIDAHAVVDPQLRVNGVEGLRVADASIMPTLIGGNTNAPAIMIGEKAADLILGEVGARVESLAVGM